MFKRKLCSTLFLACGLLFSAFGHAAEVVDAPARAFGALPPTMFKAPPDMSNRDAAPFPASVDLSAWTVPVGDQDQINSCVAWAIGHGMMGWFTNRYGGPPSPRQGFYFAPMYMYSQINWGVDKGAYLTDAFDLLMAQGIDTQSHYNHTESPLAADYLKGDFDWKTQPTPDERANAANYKIDAHTELFAANCSDDGTWVKCDPLGDAAVNAIKSALATSQHPVAIGFHLRFHFNYLPPNMVYTDLASSYIPRGLHAVLAVGYDDTGLWVQNSWGPEWGTNGFFRMSWDAVKNDVVQAHVMYWQVPEAVLVQPYQDETIRGILRLKGMRGTNPNAHSMLFRIDGHQVNSVVIKNGQIVYTVGPNGCSEQQCELSFDTMAYGLSNGPHSADIRIFDVQGNVLGTSKPITFHILNDYEVPVVHITSPTYNGTVDGRSYTFTATATDDLGVTGVEFILDGTTVKSFTSPPYTQTFGVMSGNPQLPSGLHTLVVKATDASSKSGFDTVQFTAQSFQAELTQSADTTTAGQPFSLTWSAEKVTSCVLETATTSVPSPGDWTRVPCYQGQINGSCMLAPTALGSHRYRYTCTNAQAQSVSSSLTHSVTWATAPTLSVTHTPSPMVAGQNMTTTWSSTDATTLSYSCTAGGTGFAGSSEVPVNGEHTQIADPAWVGHPSECTWTATGMDGVTTTVFQEILTTVRPPTISVTHTPFPMVAGQNMTSAWSSTDAITVSYVCTANGTGFAGSGIVPVTGSNTQIASPDWVGYPSNCLWTATGHGGTITFLETLVTVAPTSAITSLLDQGSTVTAAGDPFTLTWGSTNATSCALDKSIDGGSWVPVTSCISGSANGSCNPAPVIVGTHVFRNTCSGSGGTSSSTVSHKVNALGTPPTISVTRTPSPMAAGQNVLATWTSTNATSVTYVCSAAGKGFTGSGVLATVNGSTTHIVSDEWVGYPSTCLWTATGPGGSSTFQETLTTVTPSPVATLTQSTASTEANAAFTLTWGSTNATSCTLDKSIDGGPWGPVTSCVSGPASGSCNPAPPIIGTHVFRNTCTGPGGTSPAVTMSHTVTAATPPPTISVIHTPSPMVAGQHSTSTWSSTHATTLAFTCTANGTGFTGAGGVPVDGSNSQIAADEWVDYPSSCLWTATGPGGTTTFQETLTTVRSASVTLPLATIAQSVASTEANAAFTLTWGSTDASACVVDKSIDGGPWTAVALCGGAASGSCTPMPYILGTHVYRNVCSGPGGTSPPVTLSHAVTALPPPVVLPVATLAQSTASTEANAAFTLTWGSTDATACVVDKSIDGGPWTAVALCGGAASGSCTPMPYILGTHVYRNVCTGPGGTSSPVTMSHTVTAPPPVPAATLAQSTASTEANAAFTLTWGSSDATACVVDKSIDGGPWTAVALCGGAASGSCTPMPYILGTHVYRNICSGPGGTSPPVTLSHTVTAPPPPVPTASISQSSGTTVAGEAFTLYWSSANATACVVDKSINGGAWGAVGCFDGSTNGSCVPAPTIVGTHVFRNICSGPGGTSAAAMTAHTVQ